MYVNTFKSHLSVLLNIFMGLSNEKRKNLKTRTNIGVKQLPQN